MIEAIDFCKAYDSTVAVAGLSFCVAPGQVLGLVGPNGAGKTTTLRALTGIIPSSGGRLRIAGFDIDREPLEAKRRAAYVADDPQLFHELTVEQHLAFTASVYRVNRAAEKITSLLEAFDLQSKRGTRTSDLSRGMRQKLAICCAYLHDPQALMLDEPMTGLDPHGIRVLKQSIRERAGCGSAASSPLSMAATRRSRRLKLGFSRAMKSQARAARKRSKRRRRRWTRHHPWAWRAVRHSEH